MLREKGLNAYVLKGGFSAWRKAGHETEPVPAEDVLMLPRFE